jgi:hypothetical protein
MLRGVGSITRSVDLSGVGGASLTYYAKKANWESGDQLFVEASSDGSSWTTLRTHTNSSGAGTSYSQFTEDLSAFAGANTFIRFRGGMTANDVNDQFYIDTVEVRSGYVASSNGYLNTNDDIIVTVDGSGNVILTCNEDTRPRERQLDVRSLNLARAIKAQGVEIFVVAFTAPTIASCNLGSGTIWNDVDPAECNTVLDAIPGPIGDSTRDTSANVRLLKCIASSKDETDDHYFHAATASELPGIFTQIASKIAHRLVE